MPPLADLWDAISAPLAELLRAAADWVDSDIEFEQAEPVEPARPKWVLNDRGGVDPF